MGEIKPNMYVRYKTLSNQIKIAKIIKIDDKILDLDNKDCTTEKYFLKEPSYNIIDLIEEGDYVNGIKVDFIEDGYIVGNYDYDCWNSAIQMKDVKNIVTKEMFEQMKYEVK